MPTCFRCNSTGRCRSCTCRKGGIPCVNCLPSRQGRCANKSLPISDNISPPATEQKVDNSDYGDAGSQNTADIAQCNTDEPTSKASADALTPDVCYLLYQCRIKQVSIKHALMSCPMGGFPIVRHNELRDITASLMTEVCHGVSVEPTLQTLSVERLAQSSAISTDGARVDIQATVFLGVGGKGPSLM